MEDDLPILIEVDVSFIRDLVSLAAIAIQMAAGSSVGIETDLLPTMVAQSTFGAPDASVGASA